MGIFSLFGKKDGQSPGDGDREDARAKRSSSGSSSTPRPASSRSASPRQSSAPATAVPRPAPRRKPSAEETALKIDAIESEMSSEFVKYGTPANSQVGPTTTTPRATVTQAPPPTPPSSPRPAAPPPVAGATLTGLPSTTQMLMAETYGAAALSVSEAMPVIEEAAILYANGQTRVCEQMLQQAIADDHLGDGAMVVWGMLFDLYLVTGRQEEFDQLSIAYANKFETSPPTWVDLGAAKSAARPAGNGATPVVSFPPKLDANITRQLERVQTLAASHRTLRLEFARVTQVDPVGCGILLSVLNRLQKSGNDLVLVGSQELAQKIRAILEVGRRDETEAPWLLLLEILRLLNREQEFEEASMDYCITFEVSPPAFVAPQNKVTTDTTEAPAEKEAGEEFVMPRVIEGKVDALVESLAGHAESHNPTIVDCTRLVRVDFGAAGNLLTGLAPLMVNGARIEFHHVNHLVAALFQVIGLNDIIRVVPRKA